MKTYEFNIEGMTCDNCAFTINTKLEITGVKEKNVSYPESRATVVLDETKISAKNIKELINNNTHYKVVSFKEIKQEKHLIIIGGGSAAFAATIQAKEYGVKVTMINAGLPIGGTCVNVGCVPSKNLIRASETMHKSNNNNFEGISSTSKLIDFKALMQSKEDLVLDLREQKYINIIKDMDDFELIEGRASLVSAHSVTVGERLIEGSHILITTGAHPMIANIKGLNEVNYLTNEEAFALEVLPKTMIVMGGSYIALEIAQIFSRLGTKVTVLQRSSRILSNEQDDIAKGLSTYLEEEGINIINNNDIQSVSEDEEGVTVYTLVDGKETFIKAQKIVIATGRKANTADMNLEEVGIRLQKNGSIEVNELLQTSIETVYAAGDVLGSNMFVYAAAYEGKLAASNAFSSLKKKVNYTVLPWVIFTDPQVAGVGMDEVQAKNAGIDYEVAMLPLSYVPRSIAAKDTRGFIKLLRNREDDTFIGARILAAEGSELLMEIALAIRFGIKVSELKEMLHPYLTLSEGIKLAAIAFSKDVKELSCCAT
ncbi:MAG: mercury(II) reductase [Arcobacter sp.]|nr:MAG: mercury(II) reductase [Arcobacter sp.]